MTIDETVLSREENAKLRLRALYRTHGYAPFKMSKFEEYDLYVRNKDFLISDSVITFTDTDGKLLALKPDVTLSIIKNSRELPGSTRKVCYDENVYRISDHTRSYREIPQVGLECIGAVDRYQQSEVLCLAARSLSILSPDYLMDVSHLGIISGALETVPTDRELQKRILHAIGEKNADAIRAIAAEGSIAEDAAALFISLLSCDGKLADVLPAMDALCVNDTMRSAVLELRELCALLSEEGDILSHLRLDFSVVNNMKYYSGIVFQGFLEGIPQSVLSGGQYDHLMRRMGRMEGGIGFAVYPELLQQLPTDSKPDTGADTLLLYGENADPIVLRRAVRTLIADGACVLTASVRPEKASFRRVLMLNEEGSVVSVEAND